MKFFPAFALVVVGFICFEKVNAQSCIFCQEEVFEEESVLKSEYFSVVLDYEPRVYGHLLVIPKRHVVKAHELLKKEWENLSTIIPKVVHIFSKFLDTEQYVIIEKNGPNAFQDVPHVHFHLLPVTNQSWAEIFDVEPERLDKNRFNEELKLFRSYFESVQN